MINFLILVLAAGLIILAVVSRKPAAQRKSQSRGRVDKEFVARKWQTIETMAAGRGGSLRDAVSEADKLLDYALKNNGVPGETMGERLKNSGNRFSNLNDIWTAHKLG